MTMCFNQYVIGMNTGNKTSNGSSEITYLWFAEVALASPMQMRSPSEARFLEDQAIANSYIKSFEAMDSSYKGKLFIVQIKCQAVLPGSTFLNTSSQKKSALKIWKEKI